MGRGYAQDAELEEGDRDPQGGRLDRLLRRRERRELSHGNQELQADVAGPALLLGLRLQGDHQGREAAAQARRAPDAAPAAATTTAASPRASAAAATSSATASSTGSATRSACPPKVATIEYDPNRTARIALLHYVDGEKRYILAPDGLKVGDKIVSSRNADIKPGNSLTLRHIPLGTMIHNIELKKGKGGQLVRSAGVGARRSWPRTATTRRSACPRARSAWSTSTATPPSARCRTSTTRTSRSARPAARAGSGGARTTAASR